VAHRVHFPYRPGLLARVLSYLGSTPAALLLEEAARRHDQGDVACGVGHEFSFEGCVENALA
jgi:hypothetical protein